MQNQEHLNTGFRKDINGLRAWAVVAVVLYHFGVPGFSGGFVGVDIFFVISGFLMTGLVFRKLDGRSSRPFSLIEFYLARARRIIPALAVLCLILLVSGYFFLSAPDYRKLGKHAVAAVFFVSNIQFWRESGYFDAASHEKLLLHTWSLSAEWQFYMVLPVALAALWRLRPDRRFVTYWIFGIFGISLACSAFLSGKWPSASFYLLLTRAWEMLAGGLVFTALENAYIPERKKRLLEGAGLVLVIGSISFIDPGMTWPGLLAIFPVLGTAMIILAARTDSVWTGSRPAQWLGNTSYSVYLWHWPIVVILAYMQLINQPVAIAFGIAVSLAAGHFSWKWIEQTTRRALSATSTLNNLAFSAVAVLSVAMLGAFISAKHGIRGRIDSDREKIYDQAGNLNPRRNECFVNAPETVPECTYGGSELAAIVIGDSHAASFVRTVESAIARPNGHVLDWTYTSCPTLSGVNINEENMGAHCRDFIQYAIRKEKTLGDAPIFIINRTSAYLYGPNDEGREAEFDKPIAYFDAVQSAPTPEFLAEFRKRLIDTACEFADVRPTYLLRPVPELRKNVPKTMGDAAMLGQLRRVSISLAEYHKRNQYVWDAQDAAQHQCGVRILDPLPYLCSNGRCWGDINGMPIYSDDDHLNERGAQLLLPLFKDVLDK